MTELEAANRALMLLGVAPIGSLADLTQAARVMSILMDGTKKAVLCEFPWPFVLRIVPLARASGSVPGYEYAFVRPADALDIQRVYSAVGNAPMEYRIVGGLIGAHESAGKVEYVANVTDLNDWPRSIQECFVTRLAADAAMTLTGSPDVVSLLLRRYTAAASHAQEVSVVEEGNPINRRADIRNSYSAR